MCAVTVIVYNTIYPALSKSMLSLALLRRLAKVPLLSSFLMPE